MSIAKADDNYVSTHSNLLTNIKNRRAFSCLEPLAWPDNGRTLVKTGEAKT